MVPSRLAQKEGIKTLGHSAGSPRTARTMLQQDWACGNRERMEGREGGREYARIYTGVKLSIHVYSIYFISMFVFQKNLLTN